MNEIHLGVLIAALIVLILVSAFFSSSETALISLNRYRLRHLAKRGHGGAVRAQKLLEQPDRLIGLILLGNNFANILASSIATVIGLRVFGDSGIAVATGIMTFALLIFAEVAPKTAAAISPERIAWPAAYFFSFVMRFMSPLIRLINLLANSLLFVLGFNTRAGAVQGLSTAELQTIVRESSHHLPEQNQSLLLSVLELEQARVEDIMIPRAEIFGIDIDVPWDEVLNQLRSSPYSRIPVFHGSVEHTVGIINVRRLFAPLMDNSLTKSQLKRLLREPYYVPEGTPLTTQLLNFQTENRRSALVVDEYGDVLGMVTLEDILEEIVGDFTTDPESDVEGISRQEDGSYLLRGNVPIREINRELAIELPTQEASTLNGLIIEQLETLPTVGAVIEPDGVQIEVLSVRKRAVEMARLTFKMESGAS
ncbi:magnesium/cobalt efflux protein [Halothiobacillus diazotrophicus]|uniref:Magnesium/cobalt efflux protein n=1 Tax=Halothiobacillus diazotrophicus TaxID=1860122 RepID=A0A191ZJU0_9GAMM|nr:HlyC/CorC family transporter [Halothiobacillus diazotrophicus]ANJ68103.1 magnesium/cobalt efflux protein [Halothiobacillus diazotrophicus]